jgi:hypothetical protein
LAMEAYVKTAAVFLAQFLIPAYAILAVPAEATTYLVRPDGSGDFPTIQSALDAATDGDEILLASGAFQGAGNGNLTFQGKSLVVRSESGDPENCVIDCAYRTRGFQFISGETREARLESVRVTHGRPNWGGAIYCVGSSPSLVGCVFDESFADLGGGVYVDHGSPLIRGCRFYWCGHVYGADTAGGAIYSWASQVDIEDCYFDQNGSPEGGGIWAWRSLLHVIDSTFRANFGDGPALWCEAGTTVVMAGCTVFYNLGGGEDAQIHLEGGSNLHAERTLIAFCIEGERAVFCDGSSTANLSCCCVYGNPGGDWVGCLAGQEAVNDNLWIDPIICSLEDLDPHLRSDSPCAAENNPACGQIGSLGVGCDAPVPVRVTTWGRIKAGYR